MTSSSSTGLEPNVASALAYLAGPFSGALVLAAERSNADVRFHAWQSILSLGGLGALGMLLYILAFTALFVSANAFRFLLFVSVLVWLAWLGVWALCLVKAYQGQRFALPLTGGIAERRAPRGSG